MAKDRLKGSTTITIKRSSINFAPYNPKKHTKEAIKQQRKNFERVGFLGGIVWNKTTGNLVSGHKRVMAHDLYYGYKGSPDTDYDIKVEMVEMDEKTEKEQNIYMDNASTNTPQDYDLLAQMIPEIDYEYAGFTLEDLNVIGVDYLFQTPEEIGIAAAIDDMMNDVNAERDAERDARKAHNRQIKEQVRKAAEEKAMNNDAYVVLSFDTFNSKASFMRRFGYDPRVKFLKGEVFGDQVERTE
jgi:hypothetical protein